jgi:ATP-dependent DNA helicase DinG
MSKEEIEKKIEECRLTFWGENWIWRKGQKETIVEILLTYYNRTYNVVILDCPTGGGKSIIGIVVAWILNQEGKQGYILASDLSLQEQYEKDLERGHFGWGSIKGIDNYLCIDNMEKNSLGTCRIRNITPRKMPCYGNCPYFVAREIASISPTALLNYSYWLIMMNYVHPNMGDEAIFKPRDFTICDEGHKLLDIIQNHYSPRFDPKTLEKLEKLTQFFGLYKVRDHTQDYHEIKTNIAKLFITENQDDLHEILLEIEESFEEYFPTVEKLKKKVDDEYPHEDPPKEWREALYICDWLKDIHCKVEDFNDIIDKTSTRNIVKNPTGDKELTFNCLEESYMMHKYFHASTGFTVLMSATFADPSNYLRSIALKAAKYIKMDSHFDFTKSPIYFYNRRRMTYNQIESNLPWLYAKIDEILDKHPKESGIIHTASYDLALKIHNGISKRHRRRILVYNGTEEKRQVLDMLKASKNKVVMGPSLLEGLDLKDEWSRFAIFAKVPYLSLSDKFVATKLNINPEWYRWKAIVNVLQGTGRSVRSETDWATTYILDGALADLIHNNRKAFPPEFMQRIVVVE